MKIHTFHHNSFYHKVIKSLHLTGDNIYVHHYHHLQHLHHHHRDHDLFVQLISSRITELDRICKKALSISIITLGIFSNNFNIQSCLSADSTVDYPLFNEVWNIVNTNYYDSTYNNNNWDTIRKDNIKLLLNGNDEEKVTQKMLSVLGDKYSRLLSKQLYESLWKYDAIGVGLLFQSEPGKNMYVSAPPISGSTGAKADIRKGDIIYTINGISTDGMTAIDLLDQMSNDNTDIIIIDIGRIDEITKNVNRKSITLKRSKQSAQNPVKYFTKRLNDGKLAGYIKLSEFNSESVPELKKAILDLNKQNIDELALDLRGNTGGGFQFALNIGGMFMKDKLMVVAVGKNENDRSIFKTSYPDGVIYTKPLVLITDGLSASASEVLVAGLRDNCRAAVVGEKTFGKGKIQGVFGLANGEGLTLTVAQYVSPLGTIIQSKGVTPDLSMTVLNPYLNALTGNVYSYTLYRPILLISYFFNHIIAIMISISILLLSYDMYIMNDHRHIVIIILQHLLY